LHNGRKRGEEKMNKQAMKGLSLMAVGLMLLVPLSLLNVRADTEPNDDFNQAEFIASLPATVTGNVSSSDLVDVYIFYLPNQTNITITLDWNTTDDIDLYIFTEGKTLWDYSATSNNPETITNTTPYSGYYYAVVDDFDEASVSYTLDLNTTSSESPPATSVRAGYIIQPEEVVMANTFTPESTVQNIGGSTASSVDVEARIYQVNYLLQEGFESGQMPAGWTNVSVSGSNIWETKSVYNHTGRYSYGVTWQNPVGDDWLITPQITPSADSALRFYACRGYYYYPTDTYLEVNVSTTDNNYTHCTVPLIALSEGNDTLINSWREYTADLSAWAGQPIYIGFHAYNFDGLTVYIDDVSVESYSLVWFSNATVTNIATGQYANATFSSFTPEVNRTYKFEATIVNLSGDYNTSDNTVSTIFKVVSPITLSNRTVQPSSPPYIAGNPLVINITYTHANNTAPTTYQIFLNNVSYNMTPTGTNYTEGVVYTFNASQLPVGAYSYYFYFSDGTYNITSPSSGTYSLVILPPDDAFEENDDMGNASVIVAGNYSNLMAYDDDYYMIWVPGGADLDVVITFVNANGDLDLYLYTSTGSQVDSSTSYYNDYEQVQISNNTQAGWYFIKVKEYEENTYNMTIYLNNTPANNPPVLQNAAVNPTSGYEDTEFTISVEYSDPNNDPAVFVGFMVDGQPPLINMTTTDNTHYTYSGRFPVGTHTITIAASDGFDLAATNLTITVSQRPQHSYIVVTLSANATTVPQGSSVTLSGSVLYEDNTPVPAGTAVSITNTSGTTTNADGNFSIEATITQTTGFRASATVGNFTNMSAEVTVTAIPPNHAPVLSSGGVSPTSGDTNTDFVFTVSATDADGDTLTVKVEIDGVSYQMTGTGPFTYTTKLSEGTHTFNFTASDGKENGTLAGGSITVSAAPQNHAPVLSNSGVSPTSGNTTTDFVFSVNATDEDGDTLTVNVEIDGVYYLMTGTGPFTYTTKLSEGTHTFNFTANDTKENVSLQGGSITVSAAPPPNHAPKLTAPSVSPASGDTNTEFTFTITYTDEDNDAPSGGVKIVIDNQTYDMTTNATSPNYTAGVVYTYKTKLSEGSHTVSFRGTDGKVAAPVNLTLSSPPTVTAASSDNGGSSPGFTLFVVVASIGAVFTALVVGRRRRN